MVIAGDVAGDGSSQFPRADAGALLRVVLDGTSDQIMSFAPGARVEYVNRRLVELTGIPAEDWIGKTAPEVGGCPREMAEVWQDDVSRVFDTGESVSNAVQVPLPAGMRWIEYRLDPELGRDGSVTHVISTSRDDTERKVAQARLRESEALLSVTVEGSRDATALYGPGLVVEYVNQRVAELSGVPAEAWVGKSLRELGYPESSLAYWSAHMQEVFTTGEPQSMEYEVDNSEGHRWYEASLSPPTATSPSGCLPSRPFARWPHMTR